ncbi:MAG: transposase, partial [Cyanobacteria bacterium SW_10_48_33]
SFKSTKKLLELLIEYQFFTLPDLTTYEAFSNLV